MLDKEIILALARNLIEKELKKRQTTFDELPLSFTKKGASFVTLKENGQLRGCIGTLEAYRSLSDDIQSNGYNAAFCDPRFPPLTGREYEIISVDVSILTPSQKIEWDSVADLKRIIVPGKDGITIEQQGRRATFLPQVWDELPEFDLFFSHLGLKAGLGSDVLDLKPKIEKYQVDYYSEDK